MPVLQSYTTQCYLTTSRGKIQALDQSLVETLGLGDRITTAPHVVLEPLAAIQCVSGEIGESSSPVYQSSPLITNSQQSHDPHVVLLSQHSLHPLPQFVSAGLPGNNGAHGATSNGAP